MQLDFDAIGQKRGNTMIRIQQLKINIPHDSSQLEMKIKKALRLGNERFDYEIIRQSLDARKKPELAYVYTVDVTFQEKGISEQKLLARSKNKNASIVKKKVYQFPKSGEEGLKHPPVIIGTGPAGLFCGLMLARQGYKPILLERGRDVEQRQKDVESFWQGGSLNPESNVQFGEGGAGTFSDGKLNTLVKDTSGRNHKVLEEFVKAGAKKSILYENKPHIGTDVLCRIVKRMREEIISLGGQVRFEAKVTGISVKNHRIEAVVVNENQSIKTDVAVLAIGHSARDTFSMLSELHVSMQAKAFAVGVRVEHPQTQINLSQYGVEEMESLGAADYKLTAQTEHGRGVYSFCMCPGGYVVNASSEEARLAVNGMSYSGRDSHNANSAIIVTVTPEDYTGNACQNLEGIGAATGCMEINPLAGMEFQRSLEERAYQCTKGKIPVQLYKDFKENKPSTEYGQVQPQMKGLYELANVRDIFPEFISQSIMDGMEQFGRKIKGFAREDCLLSGVESRTSSPVRIVRNDVFESSIGGLYPCGEGAGYAGGITSAAMDGIKVAEAIAKRYKML